MMHQNLSKKEEKKFKHKLNGLEGSEYKSFNIIIPGLDLSTWKTYKRSKWLAL